MYFEIIKKQRLPNEKLIIQIKYEKNIPNAYPENTKKIIRPGSEKIEQNRINVKNKKSESV